MRKITASEKAIEMYEIRDGWYMMHIKTKANGKVSRVDTYVGTEEDGFSLVGHVEHLDQPGVIASFREYNQTTQMFAEDLIDMARSNMNFSLWESEHRRTKKQ